MVKNPPADVGDAGLISGLGRSPGEGNGNPLWYTCLENPMDRGAWWATVHGVTEESDSAERLSTTTTITKMRTHFLSTPPELKSFPTPSLCLKADNSGSVPKDAESVS